MSSNTYASTANLEDFGSIDMLREKISILRDLGQVDNLVLAWRPGGNQHFRRLGPSRIMIGRAGLWLGILDVADECN